MAATLAAITALMPLAATPLAITAALMPLAAILLAITAAGPTAVTSPDDQR